MSVSTEGRWRLTRMMHTGTPSALAATQAALLAHPSVADCVVVVRSRADGTAAVVAYVVRLAAATPAELREAAAQGGGVVDVVAGVTAIPYLADGRPDTVALAALPVADADVASAWERGAATVDGVSRAVAVVREPQMFELPQHAFDLLPASLHPRDARRGAVGVPAPAPPPSDATTGRPSLASGGTLEPASGAEPAVLADILCRAATGGRRARRGVTYASADGSERFQSYADLLGYAEQMLAGLRGMGIEPGARVLLLLPQHRDFLPALWACILGGFVPVPLATPSTYDQPGPAVEALGGAWRVTEPSAILVRGSVAPVAALAPAGDACVVLDVARLRGGTGAAHHVARPDDVALLMMTSGSTGTPKAVALTHRNLLARTRASTRVNGFTQDDVSLNWMPLDHVAGLIYFHLRDVYLGCQQVHLPTRAVVEEPRAWLDALERYRATITFAPNFAYALVLDRERELAARTLDLSSVRCMLNGAEAIVARTARRFLTALAPHGLRPGVMRPAWGMSETSSGVTYSDAFTLETTSDDQPFVEVGAPLPGVSLRVVDEHDAMVPEGTVGRLQVTGDTVTRGYFNAPEQTRDAFTADGWFKTGDLALIRAGCVTVTGREKDVVIVNSVNYYSHAIESVVDAVDGVEPSFTAACAVRRGTDTDSLAIFFVPRSPEPRALAALLPRVRAEVARRIGIAAEYVVPVTAADIPKTSLGKIQRSELGHRLASGAFDERLTYVERLLGGDETVPRWFFRRVWRPKAIAAADARFDGRRVLLFNPGGRLGEALVEELESRGAYVVSVGRCTAWAHLIAGDPPEHCIHAWDLGAEPESALEVMQAFAARAPRALSFTWAAHHVHRVLDADVVTPARAAAVALIASAAQELPWLRARHVDLGAPGAGDAARALVDEHCAPGADRAVAYRHGRRLVWGLDRETPASGSPEGVPFVRGGHYLVTGGGGGVARHVAAMLVERFDAHVLLLSRRAQSPGMPGDVAFAAADVCDLRALAAAVEPHERRWGHALDGVVHLAGSYRERRLEHETAESVLDVVRPKLAGTANVHELLAARGGGVLVTASSVAGLFGGANIGAYAAASACQDAYAQQYAGRDRVRHYCFAWSTWEDTGLSRGYRADLPRSRGYLPMSPRRAILSLLAGAAMGEGTLVVGLDAGHRHVRRHLAAVVPDGVDVFYEAPHGRDDAIGAFPVHDAFGRRVPATVSRVASLPLLASGEVDRGRMAELGRDGGARERRAPRTPAEQALAEAWRRVLQVAEVGLDDNFFDSGGDSLTAMRLAGAVREAFGVELPARAIFDAASFEELARGVEAIAPPVARQPASPSAAAAPMSEGQRALWFLHRLAPGSAALNIAFTARLRGPVDVRALALAWQALADRHPALRTVFPAEDGAPVRRVLPAVETPLAVEDLNGAGEAALLAAVAAEIDRPFSLDTGPVFRVRLFRQTGGDAVLAATFHHIAMDGGSLWACLSEMGELYSTVRRTGTPVEVREDLGFEAYLAAQAGMLAGAEGARHLEFWRERLAGRAPAPAFTADRPRPAAPRFTGASHRFSLGRAVSDRLRSLAREHRSTVPMIVLALFESLLFRHTGQEDLTVGYLASGRSADGLDGVVGYLANPLPLRVAAAASMRFDTLLRQTRDAVLDAMAHEPFPFPLVAQALEPRREPGRSPIFQVLFVYEKPRVLEDQHAGAFAVGHPGARMTLGGLELESLPFAAQREGQFDVTLVLGDVDGELVVSFDYRTELYEAATIERLAAGFTALAAGAAAHPGMALSELPVVGEAEAAAIHAVNDTARRLPATTFHALVASHAAARPDAAAVACGGRSLSYRELVTRARRVAGALAARGVTPGTIVGLCVERSFDLVIGALGILEAGAAFLPLDPAYPADRLAFMLDDSGAPLVVTHRDLGSRLPGRRPLLDLDEIGDGAAAPPGAAGAGDLAYVIYTSGSTGRPKGVLLEHRGLVNVALEQQRLFDAGPGERVLQFASLSFDAAVFELAMALGSGATLHVAAPDALLPGVPLLRTLSDERISIVTLPPSALMALPHADLPALRVITVAGEPCPQDLVERWAGGRQFFNLYGPTESTIWATASRCRPGGTAPAIGRPIANTEVYVLDAGGARAPLGVAGELYLGGAGLARAYHGRPDLTSAAFAPHPDAEGARLYKTGDRVRLLPSGELEFLGRVDSQVKVRGYRIELGEIESLLAQEPLVEQAVVAVRGSLDAARLVAYVTPRNGQRPSATELRASLRTRLPEFMVPSAVSVLDAFPLTPSGKIDRARLPEPADVRDEDEPFRAPGAGLEAAVAGIWQDVLGVPRVGVSDNFFDLGGTSLLAARVHARIEALAPGAVSLVDLFQLPTVRALTARLAGTTAPQGAARQRGALAAGRARLRAAADRRAAPGPGTGARS